MFSIVNELLHYKGKPLMALRKGYKILASGCGNTSTKSTAKGLSHVFGRGSTTYYSILNHLVSPERVVISLADLRGMKSILIRLTIEGDVCKLQVEGIPWDHNRIILLFLFEKCEITYPASGSELTDKQTDVEWKRGAHPIWATASSPSPLNGFYMDSGFWLYCLSDTLTIYDYKAKGIEGFMHRRDEEKLSTFKLEVWDPAAKIVFGLSSGNSNEARQMLLSEAKAQCYGGNPTENAGKIDMDTADYAPFCVSGGNDSVLKAAENKLKEVREHGLREIHKDGSERELRDTNKGGFEHVLKFIDKNEWARLCAIVEDWQGMHKTLLSQTINCSWRADYTLYQDFRATVESLRKINVLCAICVYPYLNVDSELSQEAVVRGYCLKDRQGRSWEDKERENTVLWLDLTNPMAIEWIKDLLRKLAEDYGVGAVVARLDKPFPDKAYAIGGDAIHLRNGWLVRWRKLCHETFKAEDIPARLVF